jgi:hypothetical protein
MSQQSYYLYFLFFFLLVACQGEPDNTPAGPATGDPAAIQIVVATDDFAVGSPRVPFVLHDGPDKVTDAQQVTLTAFDLSQEARPAGWTGEAVNYSDYAVPYWVAYPSLPTPGAWGLLAEITLRDGRTTQAQFAIQVEATAKTPAVGSQAPASENRTLLTEPDISRLSSATDPNPNFYQMAVAEAVASNKPTVVVFATPAFCQTAICAPVLDSAESVYQAVGDEANFIHLEIYKEFNPLVLADEVDEWRLSSEPWIFVLDPEGKVVARLGGPVSPRELSAALEPLLA